MSSFCPIDVKDGWGQTPHHMNIFFNMGKKESRLGGSKLIFEPEFKKWIVKNHNPSPRVFIKNLLLHERFYGLHI